MDLQVKKFRVKAYNIFNGPLISRPHRFIFGNETNNYCKILMQSK